MVKKAKYFMLTDICLLQEYYFSYALTRNVRYTYTKCMMNKIYKETQF